MVSLDIMKSRPGIYVVVFRAGVVFVETEADGDCHQLSPNTFQRDGMLNPGGWNLESIVGICGPLARPSAVACCPNAGPAGLCTACADASRGYSAAMAADAPLETSEAEALPRGTTS